MQAQHDDFALERNKTTSEAEVTGPAGGEQQTRDSGSSAGASPHWA